MNKEELQNINDKYSNIYNQIKNEIKDFVINKLLSNIILRNKENEILKRENKILKSNLLFIIKKTILEKNFQSNKLNISTIPINKKNLNNSFFSPMKLTETINDTQSDYNTLNKSRLSSLERKSNNLINNLIKNKNYSQAKFNLTKNISLYDKLYSSNKNTQRLSSHNRNHLLMTESDLVISKNNSNKYMETYYSQRDVSLKRKKSTNDNLILTHNNTPKQKKFVNLKKKSKIYGSKKSIEVQKNENKDKMSLKNRSPFLKNKI